MIIYHEINYVGLDHCKMGSLFVSTQSRRYKRIGTENIFLLFPGAVELDVMFRNRVLNRL